MRSGRDPYGCPGGASPACRELCKIRDKYDGALGIGGVIGIDKHANVLDYFRFLAFARGYRTWKDPAAVVSVDGPIDRITIVAEPITAQAKPGH